MNPRHQFQCKNLFVVAMIAIIAAFYCYSNLYAMEKPGDFPKRPLTLIISAGPGGGSDQVSRAMMTPLEKVIGVPIKGVNKPGGSGTAAFADFWAMPADGYTVQQYTDDAVTNHLKGRIKNPATDFFPLCVAQIMYSQLYIRPDDKRFQDWKGFAKYAKENPEKLTVANLALEGLNEKVLMDFLQEYAGLKLTTVHIESPAQRYAALVGGHTDSLFEQPGDVKQFLKSGDMKPILSFSDTRSKEFPDVPTVKEVAGDSFPVIYRFRAFYIKEGVPADRVKYLEWAFGEAWKSESFQTFLSDKSVLDDSYRNVEGGLKLIQTMIDVYTPIYKKLGFIK